MSCTFQTIYSEQSLFGIKQKGSIQIQNAMDKHQRSWKKDKEYIQICSRIDTLSKKYPWSGEKYHSRCYLKFTKVCII